MAEENSDSFPHKNETPFVANELLSLELQANSHELSVEDEILRRDLFEILFGSRNFPWARREARIPCDLNASMKTGISEKRSIKINEICRLNVTAFGEAFATTQEGLHVEIESPNPQDPSRVVNLDFVVIRFRVIGGIQGAGLELSKENSRESKNMYINQIYRDTYLSHLKSLAQRTA